MTATASLMSWAGAHPLPAALVAVVVVTAIALAVRGARRGIRRIRWRAPAAVVTAAVAAVACTVYSADTSWRFAAHSLDMASTVERAAMFFAAELALFSCALMARQNLKEHGAPGTPGLLVWGITGVQVIPAYSESGIVGGTVRAVVGPILAALLWHLAMGIELRHAKPGAHSQSLPAVLFREVRERLLSRLGLAVRGRDAEQITRDRWTVRAVSLAARLAQTEPTSRHARTLRRRLSKAVGRAQVGASTEQRKRLLDLLAARRNAAALATVDLPSPWGEPPARRGTLVICHGRGGTLRLYRPKPHPVAPPSTPAGPIGTPVEDIPALFHGPHAPIVYFLRNGNRVKIGTSQNVRRRVAALSLRTDTIALALHGDVRLERELHERFTAYRIAGTEWFEDSPPVARFIASGGKSTDGPAPIGDKPSGGPAPIGGTAVANSNATGAPTGDSESANSAATGTAAGGNKPPVPAPAPRQQQRRSTAKKTASTRRSMDEWVELTRDLFHAEFARLRRNPTGDEFATAIKKAKLGTVSASTAKNIRAEILDRTELPALD